MLVLSRKSGESIFIGDDIEIRVTRVEYGDVRIAISAPKELLIVRGELMGHVEELREKFGVRKKKLPFWMVCLGMSKPERRSTYLPRNNRS